MRLDDYQNQVAATCDEDQLVVLLGLAAHAGALLDAHRRYLRNHLDAPASTSLVSRELAELLQHLAILAKTNDLSLDEIARRNVAKIRRRARKRGLSLPKVPRGPVDAGDYQRLAAMTDQYAEDGLDPLALAVPMLGLAGETGTLLVAQKKAYRDQDGRASDPRFLTVELGDVLWYAATVATHAQLQLEVVLAEGVATANRRRSEQVALINLPADLPVLDDGYPSTEQLPRRLVIRFQQIKDSAGHDRARLTLIDAAPNPFPAGPIDIGIVGKLQGFTVPGQLGDPLTDNSRRADDYRFHDAIHLGFLAVMGWSPVIRSLLAMKRRSRADIDENEDGARAIFAEEGLAAVLAKQAPLRQGFIAENTIEDDIVEMLATVLEDLEVSRMPPWLWRRAVTQGFRAMRALADGRGGFLVADLDTRSLTYSKTSPPRRRTP